MGEVIPTHQVLSRAYGFVVTTYLVGTLVASLQNYHLGNVGSLRFSLGVASFGFRFLKPMSYESLGWCNQRTKGNHPSQTHNPNKHTLRGLS